MSTTSITKIGAADRLHQVRGWILSGASEHEIAQAIAATWPDAKGRPLIVDAMKRIARDGAGDPDVVRAWTVEATRLVYQRAMEAGDYASALRALRQIVELTQE